MKLINTQKLYLFTTLLAVSLFTLQACGTTGSDEEEHSDPFGAVLIMDDKEIAAQENDTITYNDGDHLELEAGSETNTILLRWIDEDGNRFSLEPEEGYSLQWIVADESVLEVEHEEDGPWSFRLVGAGAGETTVVFKLFHSGHEDFTTQPFQVLVN